MKYTIMKYLRISSEDIDLDGLDKYESNSIAHQRALLDDFILKTPEFASCDIMEALDDGRTGTNFGRPGIQSVLDLAQRGKIQCIIVKDLSRFGRSYLEVGDYLEQLFPAWGVRFISVTDMYDSAQHIGSTGGINIAFRNLIAELYSQDLSEKVRSAHKTVNSSGKTSAAYSFYGYRKDPADRHKLIVDEPAAEIVRLIFNLREQGVTTPKIARKLNDDGIQTASERKNEQGAKRSWLRNGKENIWDTGYVTRILGDERYTGKHIFGKLRRVELGKQAVKAVPRSEWIVVPDAIPAIISEEQFQRVREIMKAKTKTKVNKKNSATPLFYRKMFCSGCGRALTRLLSGSKYVYCCNTPSMKTGLGCMQGRINENDVIDTVLTVIQQQARLADSIKSQKSAKTKAVYNESSNLQNEIQNLQRLIDKANATKLSLWEKQHNEAISLESFQKERERLTEQVAAYAAKVAELESKSKELEMESGRENAFVERFSRQAGIEKLSKEVVDEFIKAIHVFDSARIEITLNYADEYLRLQRQMGS